METTLKAILRRMESSCEGTYGVLSVVDLSNPDLPGYHCSTMELPWKNNETDLSCIPLGIYNLELKYSESFSDELYEILDVPDRSSILIHVGNWAGDKNRKYATDSEGCILLGAKKSNLAKSDNDPYQMIVTESKNTHSEFLEFTDKRDIVLEIFDDPSMIPLDCSK